MILWLASYPKSGNTFVRSLLSSFFFSEDGNFKLELLDKIKRFPSNYFFENIGVDINNDYEVAKNYIKAQEKINNKNSLIFLKTHSSFCKLLDKYNFSDLKNSIGVIYIVRDPRNVVMSFANHVNKTYDETAQYLVQEKTVNSDKGETKVYVGSWSLNYNSWKVFKSYNKYLLIKYEDLILNTENVFKEILFFIKEISNMNFNFDKKKFDNVINSTKFDKMKDLEKKYGFNEAEINEKTGKKNIFFNLGPHNNWEKNLDLKIKLKIENNLSKEMKELGYL